MRLTVNLDKTDILYLLELDIDGVRVYKIGITTRKIEERVCEILTSYFKGRRYFCYCKPKRYRKVAGVYEKEQWLLNYLSEYKYEVEAKFSGSTELVSMDLDILVDLYEKIVKEEEMIISEWEKCPVCGKDKKFSVFIDGKEVKSCGHKCEVADESNSTED